MNPEAGLVLGNYRLVEKLGEGGMGVVWKARDLRDELELLSREGGEGRAADVPSIAVLPFADMSREKDQAYFCEGIAEEIINALAYAGLADCWSYIYLYAERTDSVRLQAEAAGRRAVGLAPGSAQAQASFAVALSLGDRKDEAEAAFERATALDPQLFEAWYFYARHVFARGELERAIEVAIDCLEKAAAGGLLQKGWYEHDGDLDPLRGHPRFKALLERMG